MADAGADPRAVVVVQLNAETAGAAMEGPGWAEYIARRTVRELVMLVLVIDDRLTLFVL